MGEGLLTEFQFIYKIKVFVTSHFYINIKRCLYFLQGRVVSWRMNQELLILFKLLSRSGEL